MTESQRIHFYFPIWTPTAHKLDWQMEGGRLIADLDEQFRGAAAFPKYATDLVREIISSAQNAAAAKKMAVVPDHLRHACNRIASGGHYESSTKFTQRHLNHFDRLCAVLREPDKLKALQAWLNPAEDDRQRSLAYLRKIANEGKLRAIALNAWATHDVDTLTQAQLDALLAEIKKGAWPKYPKAKIGKRESGKAETQPY